LHGNYVTLTNLSKSDIARIVKYRISPVNVSVHTFDPELREFMIGRKDTNSYKIIKLLVRAGIKLNCQIVCCPGINDGWQLSKTIEVLMSLGKNIHSVSIVPVGLTKHRQELTELRPFDKKLAVQTIRQVDHYREKCIRKQGAGIFYCADEIYMTAGFKLPANKFYEDYPQLENGVGMMRLLINEFKRACKDDSWSLSAAPVNKITLVTGTLAAPYLTKLLQDFCEKYVTIYTNERVWHRDKSVRGTVSPMCEERVWFRDESQRRTQFLGALSVCPIINNFFGESVTVSGLVTGQDIIDRLKDIEPGSVLLIPQNMLRFNDNVFLDDITVEELAKTLSVKVIVVKQNGAELYKVLKQLVLNEHMEETNA